MIKLYCLFVVTATGTAVGHKGEGRNIVGFSH